MQPKWNARTVIRRALIVAETLLQGEEPRFKLDGDVPYYETYTEQDEERKRSIEFLGDFSRLADLQEAYPSSNVGDLAWAIDTTYRWNGTEWKFRDNIYPLSEIAEWLQTIETPEFQFTQSTLREILQEVGRFVHAEPRLINSDTITFDKLGSGEISDFTDTKYASKSWQQAVDNYATNLYSTVGNFVNSINYANGVMVEPFSSGFKTVRTENLYLRLEDTNIHIQTQYPIRAIRKLECGYVSNYDETVPYDITAFVYESAEYQRLSSYGGAYPSSKAWAIYYTIGEKGVYGLTFKTESAYLQAFNNYAIVNILNAVTREAESSTSYTQLAFRITYEPIYPATAQQSKSYVGDIEKPASLVYNQGQNMVESHYFGENMKGAIARLGNVDKVLTYVKHGLVDSPKVGQILIDGNDEYYISAVATEIQPYYTKFSMSLSKDFNRYSDYIKVNSEKRMYEISERQAFDSHITYKDYVVIGDMNYNSFDDGLIKGVIAPLGSIFTQQAIYEDISKPVSFVRLTGYSANGGELSKIILPIQKSAIGNSALFTTKYKDNYSAGDNVVKVDNNYWQNGVAYSDFFGNIEYLDIAAYSEFQNNISNLEEQTTVGNALPLYSDVVIPLNASFSANKMWIKKGSTEIPTIDYQIDFVTNRSNIIIGSALAKNFPLVSGLLGVEHKAKLYLFSNKRINKFEKIVDVTDGEEFDFNISLNINVSQFEIANTVTLNKQYKSWAIIDGATNELLVGCNKTINTADEIFNEKTNTADESPKGLKMFIKHDIFKDKI